MNPSAQSVQGGTRLVFDSVEGITNTVERMHETIAGRALPGSQLVYGAGRAHGITASAIYAVIRGVNSALRAGVDRSFDLMPAAIANGGGSATETRMVSALNGAFGDHLEATGNTLAIPMALTTPHHQLVLSQAALSASIPKPSPHLVVLVRGLCLSEASWQRQWDPCP